MTRRKREIVGLRNERDFPYLVELALPPGGRSRHEVKPFYIRFCFPDAATADAFRDRFGGERLTHALLKPKQDPEKEWGKRGRR